MTDFPIIVVSIIFVTIASIVSLPFIGLKILAAVRKLDK